MTPALCPALLHYLDKSLLLIFNKCQMLLKKKLSLNEYGASPSLVQYAGSVSCSAGYVPCHSMADVALGMETPLVMDHSVPDADFQSGQLHAP